MENTPSDPAYLQALIQGLQQQRNQANDTIAHLAAQHVQKDARITALEKQLNQLLSATTDPGAAQGKIEQTTQSLQ